MRFYDDLQTAISDLHGCDSVWVREIEVVDMHEGTPAWSGAVQLFALHGHAKADRCYAWSEPVEGATRRRFFAVLHHNPVFSASDAVRASIVQRERERRGE